MFFRPSSKRLPILPAGSRVYAIGDIHGEAALLIRLLHLIKADSDARQAAHVVLVFLGDLIDRGPDGAALVRTFSRLTSEEVIVLKGNHEAALEEAYKGDETTLAGWLSFGAAATLAGFGVTPSEMAGRTRVLIDAMRARIEPGLVNWLTSLPAHWEHGDYFFAHAGVQPGVRLDRQNAADLLWIREPFLSSRRNHGKVVIHGHSVEPGLPRLGGNRIGIDTGAHEHGTLTALGLEGTRQWLLQTRSTSGPDDVCTARYKSTGQQDRAAPPTPALLSDEIDRLISSIVASKPEPERSPVALPDLTTEFIPARMRPWAMIAGSDKQGQIAARFALALFACGAAVAAYLHSGDFDRPPHEVVASKLPSLRPVLPAAVSATPANHPQARKRRAAVRKVWHPQTNGKALAQHDKAQALPTMSIDPRDQPSPRLYGAELQRALAEDRVITRQLNIGELARLQARGSGKR